MSEKKNLNVIQDSSKNVVTFSAHDSSTTNSLDTPSHSHGQDSFVPRRTLGSKDELLYAEQARQRIIDASFIGEDWVSLSDYDEMGSINRNCAPQKIYLHHQDEILRSITKRLRFVLLFSMFFAVAITIIMFLQSSFTVGIITILCFCFYLCIYLYACLQSRFSKSYFLSRNKLRILTHSIGLTYFLICGITIYIHNFFVASLYLILVPLVLLYALGFNFFKESLLWGILAVILDAVVQVIGIHQGHVIEIEMTTSRILINLILICFLLIHEHQTFIMITAFQNHEQRFIHQTKDLRIAKQAAIDVSNDLRKERDLASRSERIKSDFLSNMSHEIRTPLTGVLGLTEMLMQTELQEEQRQDLQTIINSGKSLLIIINDILDFSKIEAGKMEMEKIAFDPLGCVEDVLEIFGPKAYKKKVELVCHLKGGQTSNVLGDATRVKQILINLIGNAIKFTNKGHVRVTIDIKPTEEFIKSAHEKHMGAQAESKMKETQFPEVYSAHTRKKYIHFQVKDDGIGIDKQAQKCLFSAYTQADISTSRKFGGTGLGLMISLRLTEMMGGHMWVESKIGKGAAFNFTIEVDEVLPRVVHLNTPHVIAHHRSKSYYTMGLPEQLLRSSLGSRSLSLRQTPVGSSVSQKSTLDPLRGMRLCILEHTVVAIALKDLCQSWGLTVTIIPLNNGQVQKKDLANKIFDFMIIRITELQDGFLEEMIKQFDKMLFIITTNNQRDCKKYNDNKRVLAVLLKPIKSNKLLKAFCTKWKPAQKAKKKKPLVLNQVDGKMKVVKLNVKKKKKNRKKGWSPLKILVAEDNPVNQKVIMRMLTHLGYRCDMTSDGKEAVNKVKEKFYHVILMDLQMPNMGGIEAAGLIRDYQGRSSGSTKRSKIFALTASVLKKEREACEAAGMSHLAKPIDLIQLTEVLSDCARNLINQGSSSIQLRNGKKRRTEGKQKVVNHNQQPTSGDDQKTNSDNSDHQDHIMGNFIDEKEQFSFKKSPPLASVDENSPLTTLDE